MKEKKERSVEVKHDLPTPKNANLYKRIIEEKLREIKAIRIAFSR